MVAQPTKPIDIEDVPALAHLVDEVARSQRPRAIQRGGETIAMLVPAAPKRRRTGLHGPEKLITLPPPRYANIEEMVADHPPKPVRAFTDAELKAAIAEARDEAWRAKERRSAPP